MSKHTPGPFEIKKDSFAGSFYLRCKGAKKFDGFIIERIVARGICSREDARLFAAAPDLLIMLEEARRTLEMWKDVAPAVSLCADIDKVIARARGEK